MSQRARRLVRIAMGAGLCLVLLGLVGLSATIYLFPYDLRRLEKSEATSLTITDRNGGILRQLPLRGGGRASWVPLSQIPSALIAATLVGEDRRFYSHRGVDLLALLRAVFLNLRGTRLTYGGSTLSMQLVRLLEPHPRTLRHKIKDLILALRLERAVDKKAILEQYLNRAYYGNGAFGVEAAARHYFGRPASALADHEAIFLSLLPRAPSAYDPRRKESLARTHKRYGHVLHLLKEAGHLTAEQETHLAQRAIVLADPPIHKTIEGVPYIGSAPHFVDHVLSLMPTDLSLIPEGQIRTTLDRHLQERVERAVKEHVEAMRRHNLNQAGVVVLEPQTGAIRALVGSANYWDPRGGQINITTTPRNPGSALKPFTYALALELGDTPATLAWDVVDVPSSYQVGNADGKEHGPVRYRLALPCSYNLAAVHVAERVGIGRLVGRLRHAGLTTLNGGAETYGPSLTLGSGAVRLVDLAAAYGFLVNDGAVVPATFLEGRPSGPRRQVFSPQVSWLLQDILSDPDARRPAFGDDLPFDLPYHVAAKTGTSGGFSDNLAVIATREVIVAAWAGNFDGKGMHAVLAMSGAAPLARAALLAASMGRNLTLAGRPEGLVEKPICPLSGAVPTQRCPHKLEWFVKGTEPKEPCSFHQQDPARADGVLVRWPKEAERWAARRATRP